MFQRRSGGQVGLVVGHVDLRQPQDTQLFLSATAAHQWVPNNSPTTTTRVSEMFWEPNNKDGLRVQFL